MGHFDGLENTNNLSNLCSVYVWRPEAQWNDVTAGQFNVEIEGSR